MRELAEVPEEKKSEYKIILRAWLDKLPYEEVHKTFLHTMGGVDYSPKNLVEAVEDEDEFGIFYLKLLFQLEKRFKKRDPDFSIVSMINRSIQAPALAAFE